MNNRNRTSARFVAAGTMVLAFAATATAQSTTPLAELLPSLSAEAAVIAPGTVGDHRGHFAPDPTTLAGVYELNRVMALQAGGFAFGPSALAAATPMAEGRSLPAAAGGGAETALTIGAGNWAFALGYQATTFDTLDDIDLRASDMNLFLPHAAVTGTAADRDLMQQVVSLRLNRKVASLALTYGLSDRVDLGVIVPFVQMHADARVTSRIIRTGSSIYPGQTEHQFDPIGGANRTLPRYCSELEAGFDPDALQCHGSSEGRGVGDILVRAKVRLAGAVAAGADVRVPTGRVDDFIGIGAWQVRPYVAVSGAIGRVVPRVRVDYTWSDGDLSAKLGGDVDRRVPDEVGVSAGVDAGISRYVALVFDVAARRIDGLRTLSTTTLEFPGRGVGGGTFLAEGALVAGDARTVTQTLGAGGVRLSLPGDLLGQMSVVFPIGRDGLQPGPTAVFSLTRSY